jgi:tetratricopeptide (TPR) repeat protein
LPKGEGAYVRAKRADQLDDLSQAEAYFREEIASQGPNRLSAVKDLASLLSRIGRGEEAISLLEQTRSQFEFVRPVDNLLANFNFKSGHFDKAAEIFQRLQIGADRGARVSLIRQEAFCEFASGRYDRALALLVKLHEREPLDMQTSNLIERVKQAREAGQRGALSAPEDEVLDIETISSGLSPFAKTLLDTCDYRGVDERSRARGFYDEKDFSAVEEQLNRVRGRRPRERADLSLTLAAIAFKAPEVAGDRTVHEFLRRYFTFMGEAAIYDNLHRDVARCHLTEAICYATMHDIEAPLGLLVATYSSKDLNASEFGSQIRMFDILTRFHNDEKSWERLAADVPYYSSFSVGATRRLDGDIRKDRVLRNFLVPAIQLDKLRGSEAARIRKERTQLLALQSSLSSAGMLQDNVEILGTLARATRFELDRQRLLTLGSLLGEATLFWQDQDYVEKESKYARLTSGLSSFTKEIVDSPTKLSAEVLQPLAKRLQEQMLRLFEEFQRNAAPELELSNVLGDDYSLLGEDGNLPVTLQLTSKAGSAPVEGIEVVISDEGGLELASPAFSPEVLRGGQSREVRVVLKPSSSQIDDGAFTMLAAIKYRTRRGDVGETGRRAIPVRLGSSIDFVPIVNPYHAYSGGTPVERPEMFFGRAQLLDRIESEVTDGPLGQCFVLYGQKRSGKTSILRQLERRVNKRAITVPVTVGIMDTKEAEAEFVQMCIDKLFERLKSHYEINCSCPVSSSEVTSGPIRAFRIAVTAAQKELDGHGYSSRVVLLIDEFSCIYEYIKEGIMTNAFMRHWKALLQMEAFSAVVVGQDSMPKFKQAFSNEFGVTHDERITYLARTEAIELAEAQIMLDGKTRYRGKALDRLLDLTAGSPFYLQIMCDRLVRHLNREKAVFVTEADIDIVARELVSGDDALPVEKFDPLITAAGESVAEASRETYLGLLNGIAQHSRQTGFASAEDVKPFEQSGRLLQDLAEREVIVRDSAGRVAIKVQLFSEWLRENYMIG